MGSLFRRPRKISWTPTSTNIQGIPMGSGSDIVSPRAPGDGLAREKMREKRSWTGLPRVLVVGRIHVDPSPAVSRIAILAPTPRPPPGRGVVICTWSDFL